MAEPGQYAYAEQVREEATLTPEEAAARKKESYKAAARERMEKQLAQQQAMNQAAATAEEDEKLQLEAEQEAREEYNLEHPDMPLDNPRAPLTKEALGEEGLAFAGPVQISQQDPMGGFALPALPARQRYEADPKRQQQLGELQEELGEIRQDIGMKGDIMEGIYERAQETQSQYQAQLSESRKRRAEAEEAAMDKVERAQLSAKYANAGRYGYTIDDIQEAEELLEDPNLTPQERTEIQKKLDKASSIDTQQPMAQRILAAIGMALGAYGSAITKTPNDVIKIVEARIAREVQAQKFKFQRAGYAVKDAKDAYALAMKEFDNETSATLMAQSQAWKMAQIQADKLQGMVKNDQQRASLAQMSSMSLERAENAEVRLHNMEVDNEMRRAQLGLQRTAMGMKAAGAGAAISGKQAELSAKAKAAEGMIQTLEQDFYKKTGKFSFLMQYMPMTSSGEYNDAREMVAQFLGKDFEGRMTNEDYERFLGFMPTPGMSKVRAQNKFNKLRSFLQEKMKAMADPSMGEGGPAVRPSGTVQKPKGR